MNILFLLTDAYGGYGGISRFNRDLLDALNASPVVTRVHAVPRLIPGQIEDEIPEAIVYDRAAARGKTRFTLRSIKRARSSADIDLVLCGHLNLLSVGFATSYLSRAPLALIIHGIEAWQPTHDPLVNLMASRVRHFLAVSRFSADRFTRWSKVSADGATILPNCIDLARFLPQPRDEALVSRYNLQGMTVLMTVGRLAAKERYKGFDEVIEALPWLRQHYPALKYLIVGEGDDQPRLVAKAKELGVGEHVIFAGRIPEHEKIAHYSLADAYVMPSAGEGFGIVLLEAAACGIPVIGSRVDGSQEALLNGELGRLIDPRNSVELLDAIDAVLAAKSERQRLPAIATFGVDCFRARVDGWLRGISQEIERKRYVA